MSYFLCGKFEFRHPVSFIELEELAFKIAEMALADKLAIQLGVCIVPEIVFEIVGESRVSERKKFLPFLITESPVSDVSDRLIDFNDVDGGEARLSATLNKLTSFLRSLDNESISKTIFYFSEGYDCEYRRMISSPATLADDCLAVFSEFNETVSLCAEIEL